MIRSSGSFAPASRAKVGRRSIVVTIWSQTLPAGTLPGQRQMAGTRGPPSHVIIFEPRSGSALPA